MTRPSLTLLAAGALALAASCGIPADDGPRAISQEPEDLRDGTTTTSVGQTVAAILYFSTSDGSRDVLVRVEQPVPAAGGSSAPTPGIVLEALLAGAPSEDYSTKIPPGTALAAPPQLDRSGLLTVDLNTAITNVTNPGAAVAYGQMVCTADALEEVVSVRFTVEGTPVPPPTGDGDQSSRPVACGDYGNLLAEPPEG